MQDARCIVGHALGQDERGRMAKASFCSWPVPASLLDRSPGGSAPTTQLPMRRDKLCAFTPVTCDGLGDTCRRRGRERQSGKVRRARRGWGAIRFSSLFFLHHSPPSPCSRPSPRAPAEYPRLITTQASLHSQLHDRSPLPGYAVTLRPHCLQNYHPGPRSTISPMHQPPLGSPRAAFTL